MLLGNWGLEGFLLAIPAILVGLVFHEYAHALIATWLGDPTPRQAGRLTLAPQAHLDPLGSILILVAGFGWAKPVPISPGRMRWGKWGEALTSAAGPAVNLLLAFCFVLWYQWLSVQGASGFWLQALNAAFILNLSLGLFNLLPVPPLDGSGILAVFLTPRQEYALAGWSNHVSIILLVLMLTGVFWRIFSPILSTVALWWEAGAWRLAGLLSGSG